MDLLGGYLQVFLVILNLYSAVIKLNMVFQGIVCFLKSGIFLRTPIFSLWKKKKKWRIKSACNFYYYLNWYFNKLKNSRPVSWIWEHFNICRVVLSLILCAFNSILFKFWLVPVSLRVVWFWAICLCTELTSCTEGRIVIAAGRVETFYHILFPFSLYSADDPIQPELQTDMLLNQTQNKSP